MAKKVVSHIDLHIPAAMANPSPPVGPALGQRGVSIMEFCKAFNAHTESIEKGLITPVRITVYADKSFSFITRSAPAPVLLKKAAGLTSASKNPGKEVAGKVTMSQVREIAETKAADMSGACLEANINSIMGTARSMGLVVEDLVNG